MRTIRFRGQKPSNGVWVYGSLVYSNEIDAAIYYQTGKGPVRSMEWVYVNHDTVGQFTGLLDKNGKEIYEGDVLRSDDYPFSSIQDNEIDNYYGVMFWSHEETAFNVMCVKNIKSSSVRTMTDGYSYFFSKDSSQDFEVIGNIHDPEWKQYIKFFQEAYNEQHQ